MSDTLTAVATWVAPIATSIAALMTASNLGSRTTGWGFVIFTVGSLAWIALGLMTGQSNLVWQNVVLTGLNLFGIWRWLGRQAKLEEGGQRAAAASEERPGENLFPISLLTKAPIDGSRGTQLGTVVDAMAGSRNGQLAFLVVSSGGVGGVGETVRRLPWTRARMVGERLETDLARKEFDDLDELSKDDWR